MRDPKRIKRILGKLSEIWEMMPDQRLGQLMINIGLAGDSSLWHIEDDKWEKHLDKEKLRLRKELKA